MPIDSKLDGQLNAHGDKYCHNTPYYPDFYSWLVNSIFPAGTPPPLILPDEHDGFVRLVKAVEAKRQQASGGEIVVHLADLGAGSCRMLTHVMLMLEKWLHEHPNGLDGVRLLLTGVDHARLILDHGKDALQRLFDSGAVRQLEPHLTVQLVHASLATMASAASLVHQWDGGVPVADASNDDEPEWDATSTPIDVAAISGGTFHHLTSEREVVAFLQQLERILTPGSGLCVVPVFRRHVLFSDQASSNEAFVTLPSGRVLHYERALIDRRIVDDGPHAVILTTTTEMQVTDENGTVLATTEDSWSHRTTTAAELQAWIAKDAPSLSVTVDTGFNGRPTLLSEYVLTLHKQG
eukprot:jgi/Hompol1/1814/HPOL_005746-RA